MSLHAVNVDMLISNIRVPSLPEKSSNQAVLSFLDGTRPAGSPPTQRDKLYTEHADLTCTNKCMNTKTDTCMGTQRGVL